MTTETMEAPTQESTPAPEAPAVETKAPEASAPATTEPVEAPSAPEAKSEAQPSDPFYKTLPEDWRAQAAAAVAGEDAERAGKLAKRLERYSSFEDMAKGFFDAQDKLRSGAAKSSRPADGASDDEIREWREANGIPESADKYELDLGEAVQLSEEDQSVIDNILPSAHELGISNDAMSKISAKFFEARAMSAQKMSDQDNVDVQQTEQTLKSKWGSDFSRNKNILVASLGEMPEDLRETVRNARGPDGRGLMNNPAFAQHMVDLYRKANPTVALVPNGDGDPIGTVNDEIKRIEKTMRDDPDSYYKDNALQDRYRQLLVARKGQSNQ